MTVYGIYVSDSCFSELKTPLYGQKDEAIKEAQKIVNKLQKTIDKMKDFVKDDDECRDMYSDFQRDKKTEGEVDSIVAIWSGGAYDSDSVSVEIIDVL